MNTTPAISTFNSTPVNTLVSRSIEGLSEQEQRILEVFDSSQPILQDIEGKTYEALRVAMAIPNQTTKPNPLANETDKDLRDQVIVTIFQCLDLRDSANTDKAIRELALSSLFLASMNLGDIK